MGNFISLNSYRLNGKEQKPPIVTHVAKKETPLIKTFESILKKLIDEKDIPDLDSEFDKKQLKNAEKAFAHIFKIEYFNNINKDEKNKEFLISKLNKYFENRNLENLKEVNTFFDKNYSDALPQLEHLHVQYLKEKPKLQFENCTLYDKTIECLDKLRGK
jgi:hypothetical protein